MATQWLRRACLLAACASALLLAACGGGDIVSRLEPSRVLAFGDSVSDVGQNGARYTVNDGTVNNWTHYVANSYGRTITPSSAGGLSFATGNARVLAKPDAAGNAATPTLQEQIDAFLAAGRPGPDDLLLVGAGTADVIVEVQAALAGTQTDVQTVANLEAIAEQLATQVKRLVDAGAEHIGIIGPYNMGRTPWAAQTGRGALMEAASAAFNRRLKVALFRLDLADEVMYVDAELRVNQLTGDAAGNGFRDVANPVCTSVDSGPGIGTGAGQVNSNLCTPQTLLPNVNYAEFLFADRVYLTPRGHQVLGDFIFITLRDRW